MRAILWHELGIVVVGVAIVLVTWGQPNQVATQTFLVLWVMRTSAKLNLFLGVRNLSEEFLPPHLAYLQSFFRRRPMNALLPFSVLGAGGVLTLMVLQGPDKGRRFELPDTPTLVGRESRQLPLSDNTGSIRVLEKAGYVKEGHLRQSAIKDGKIRDQFLYASYKPL